MDSDILLQPSLRGDARMEALARLIARLSALPVTVPLVNLVDLVDASALASLGEQFHVMGTEGWNLAGTEEARRALLKRAIELHRRKGTPWAVRNALETVLARDVRIREWFQYAGAPYCFRVRVTVGSGLDEALLRELFRLIHDHKNVRSWLDCLETEASVPLPEAVGVGLAGHTTARPLLHVPPPPPSPLCRRVWLCAAHATSARPRFCSPPKPAPALSAGPRLAARVVTRFRLAVPA